ncbi:hypothetical protein J6590_099335, partial [Homalodisca vitripennis]
MIPYRKLAQAKCKKRKGGLLSGRNPHPCGTPNLTPTRRASDKTTCVIRGRRPWSYRGVSPGRGGQSVTSARSPQIAMGTSPLFCAIW